MTIAPLRRSFNRPLTPKEVTKLVDSPWHIAAQRVISRDGYDLDPEVNFFVESLEAIGAKTLYSCEGHPQGFYVLFKAPYQVARNIASLGYFNVSVVANQCYLDPDVWMITIPLIDKFKDSYNLRIRILVDASIEWNKKLFPEVTVPGGQT